jgi:hypothetical protein
MRSGQYPDVKPPYVHYRYILVKCFSDLSALSLEKKNRCLLVNKMLINNNINLNM